tara:strand:+ start:130261 stop:131409 length:1149 start_codon:yes stop_codon:yes gene_type:complete
MEFPVQYIDDQAELKKVVDHLLNKESIAIDLEFDKNHYRYGFNLCLMQVFDGETCFLIDPLGDLQIETIFPVLENESISKLCFAFNEDMRLLTYMGAKVRSICDLAIARIITGKEALSLSNTLVDELNLKEQISQQKSNWFQRPLTKEQKHYAALDVIDLYDLKSTLFDQLNEQGRFKWFEEEMQQFEAQNWEAAPFEIVPEKDRKDLTLRQWMRFEVLMNLRDEFSKALNRPAFKVIDKNIIKEIAIDPKNLEKWSNTKRIHPKYRNDRIKKQLRDALKHVDLDIANRNISAHESAKKRLSHEEKLLRNQRRARMNKLKEDFFKPVKIRLSERIGDPLTNFILSNRRIQEIAYGQTELLPYQRDLIRKIAEDLGLNIPEII